MPGRGYKNVEMGNDTTYGQIKSLLSGCARGLAYDSPGARLEVGDVTEPLMLDGKVEEMSIGKEYSRDSDDNRRQRPLSASAILLTPGFCLVLKDRGAYHGLLYHGLHL